MFNIQTSDTISTIALILSIITFWKSFIYKSHHFIGSLSNIQSSFNDENKAKELLLSFILSNVGNRAIFIDFIYAYDINESDLKIKIDIKALIQPGEMTSHSVDLGKLKLKQGSKYEIAFLIRDSSCYSFKVTDQLHITKLDDFYDNGPFEIDRFCKFEYKRTTFSTMKNFRLFKRSL
jgi:hypothetical protein